MKRIALLLFALISLSTAFAQGRGAHDKMWREVVEFKVKYLAQEIDLQEADQQKFADLYTKMEVARHKVFSEAREAKRCLKKEKNASEKDYAEAAECLAECKVKDAKIAQEYDKKFATFLSQKQIYKMHEAEKAFKQKMREMRGKRK